MRSLIGLSLLAAIGLIPVPALAQEVDALRKELEQMRSQFEDMKRGYEQSINRLSERIQSLESRPQPALAPSMTAPAAPPTVSGATRETMMTQAQPGGLPSPVELVRPREPFS